MDKDKEFNGRVEWARWGQHEHGRLRQNIGGVVVHNIICGGCPCDGAGNRARTVHFRICLG